MAKKRSKKKTAKKKRAKRAVRSSSGGKQPGGKRKRTVAQKAAGRRAKKQVKKPRITRGRPYRCRGVIEIQDGFPICRFPITARKALGPLDELPVRVTLNGIDFYARVRTSSRQRSLLRFDRSKSPDSYELYIYQDMREVIDVKPGTKLDLVVAREAHPAARRGKRVKRS